MKQCCDTGAWLSPESDQSGVEGTRTVDFAKFAGGRNSNAAVLSNTSQARVLLVTLYDAELHHKAEVAVNTC